MTDSLQNVDQAAFDQAEATVIGLLRAALPAVDLRKGTVLRELIVRPASAFYALEDSRYSYMQAVRSLQAIAENPEIATDTDINHILSNFNIVKKVGATARGIAKIYVTFDQLYYIPSNFQLSTQEGLVYGIEQSYTVQSNPQPDQLRLYTENDTNYYFLLPVIAAATGDAYDIAGGTVLNVDTTFDGLITAEAWTTFTGGADAETVDALIARLPAAIAHRSLESRVSIEAILRDPDLGGFDQSLLDISIQGYGDRAQLRDKHNAFGTATGGKVDIYPRTFQGPNRVVLEKTGTLIAPNTYQFIIEADDAPGYYAIRSVTDADSTVNPEMSFDTLLATGSYPVVDVREPVGIQDTFHDIAADNAVVETAYTIFQRGIITVSNVATDNAETHQFRVELYITPQIAAMQAYVDGDAVRNLKADYLVRSPLICVVGVRAHVAVTNLSTATAAAMQQALADYINSRSFVTRLTESELLGVLHDFDILRVDTSDNSTWGFYLRGIIRDAAGVEHVLTGSVLDVEGIADPATLLAVETCVFTADPADITVSIVEETP